MDGYLGWLASALILLSILGVHDARAPGRPRPAVIVAFPGQAL